MKKRCNRSSLTCASCEAAGVLCSFADEKGASKEVSAAEVADLKRQIEWLSGCMNQIVQQRMQRDGLSMNTTPDSEAVHAPMSSMDVLTPVVTTPSEAGIWHTYAPEDLIGAPPKHQREQQPQSNPQPPSRLKGYRNGRISVPPATPRAQFQQLQTSPPATTHAKLAGTGRPKLPQGVDIKKSVTAFFGYVHEAYPFFDRIQVMGDIESLGLAREGAIIEEDDERVSMKLHMIIMIGCATLCCANQLPEETAESLLMPYHDIVAECLSMATIEAVEVLLLVTLFSIYDPVAGMSPWVLTGVLGRHAIALGLNRKSQVRVRGDSGRVSVRTTTTTTSTTTVTAIEAELRHRLFWSIYELDRMVATSFGLPFAMNDENINVPLPGVTVAEYAASEQGHYTRMLQVSRNAIALRDVEGRILQKVHLSNSSLTSASNQADRRAVLEDFRSQIDDWYAQGCLLSRLEKDSIQFHNTIAWLNVRYHSLLALLYSPSRFNSQFCMDQILDLHRTVQQFVHCSALQLQQRHFSLNVITLNRLLVVLVILLFCIGESHRVTGHGKIEARGETSLCIQILEAFPSRWALARPMLTMFRRLSALPRAASYPATNSFIFSFSPLSSFDHQEGSQTHPEGSFVPDGGVEDSLARIKADTLTLIRKGLGPSSAYNTFLNQVGRTDVDDVWTDTAQSSVDDHLERGSGFGRSVPPSGSSTRGIALDLDLF